MAAVRGRRRDVLEMYRRARPRDVPAEMVEAVAARRLAGDVAGAFAAARVDLDIDVDEITRVHGRDMADRLIDDLRHIAPDLLRWNVPRDPESGEPDGWGLLRRYPAADGSANLMVDTGRRVGDRLRLHVGIRPLDPVFASVVYRLPRAYWDARYPGELRDLCGASRDRIPFHDVDGRRLDAVPAGPRPDDPVAMTEWLTLLWDEGRTGEALAACGITLAGRHGDRWPQRPWVAVERLVADARRKLDEDVFDPSRRPPRPTRTIWVQGRDEGQDGTDIELTFGPGEQVTARRRNAGSGESRLLTAQEYRHPIDLDLLRFDLANPDDLHPAVTQALFPARSISADGPPAPSRAGTAARDSGFELVMRAVCRDTSGVLALLDAGADPQVRNHSGQTLLHLLADLDHELLLPRLLAAGVDVNLIDVQGHTALHAAAVRRKNLRFAGSIARARVEDLIGRLLNAGGVDVCAEQGAPCPAGAPAERRARPTDEDLVRLRAAASRDEYRTMTDLAWALYSIGKDRPEVLAECYGVPFPDEFFALADHMPLPGHRPNDLRCHVWRLALPADRGGPVPPPDSSDAFTERVILERDRRLVPLLPLRDHRTEYGGLVLCYRLTDLADGEPTIYGTDPLDDQGRIEQLGPSLLAVLRDYHVTAVDRLEALQRLVPRHRDIDALPAHRAALQLVETLRPAGAAGVVRSELTAPFTTAVSEHMLARLRDQASAGDFRSLTRLAWALYAAGSSPREVLAECYGVAFPDEFFVIADAEPDDVVPGFAASLTWALSVPPERGGPALRPSGLVWPVEQRILAWNPDLVPLVGLAHHGHYAVRHGELIHCYRRSELAAGRSTVFGVPWDRFDDDGELSVEASGQSLLTVLHEYATECLSLDEAESRRPKSVTEDEVEGSRQIVANIEALQRRLGDYPRPTNQ
ncbi:ankyrin repeat domain-containing protein [Micromonospora sp. WMMD1102]|uniref:ankyrin repeat domain-containing protein n=1 Tax=Micromonospora sp. WMMD1102 TaxID=3016105 RepID=UPI0024156304|nr:ankyrin repeat domain-containing protein [Micromonospora sp. WMMD1102]MDG4786106.1 ankyrin repeat domain-containing protein [Micromonospora sp. WMMD1102]